MDKQPREPIPKRHQCIAEVLDESRDEHVRKANQEVKETKEGFGTCGLFAQEMLTANLKLSEVISGSYNL